MTTFPTARNVRTTPEGLLWEPSERWVRGRKGDVTVVDSRRLTVRTMRWPLTPNTA